MDRQRETDSLGNRRHLRRVTRLARLTLGLALTSLLARWLFADRWVTTEWNFLIPLPLPILLALGAGLLSRLSRRGAITVAAGLPLLVLLLLWREQPTLFPHRTAPARDSVRLVAWNLMSYNRGEQKVTDILVADDADIVCILEGTYRGRPPEFLSKALGDDFSWASTRQMAVGTRLPLRESKELPTQTRLRVLRAILEIDGRECLLFLVDMPAPPRLDTREMYNELWASLQLETQPLILVGDFNTPRGSWHLRRTTAGLFDVHRTAGKLGWIASWPAEFPIYQLDHAFFSREFQLINARFGPENASDHQRQILEFAWRSEVPAASRTPVPSEKRPPGN